MHLPWRRGGTGRNQQAPRGVSGGVLVPSRSPCPLAHDPGRHGGSAGRGRGLAWFRTADGSVDHRFTLRLPPLRTLARWDDRPYVSPLAEVAERGRPPAWYFSPRRLSGCCTGRTAGSPNPPGRYMRSSQASGAIMTPTSDIPAGHPPACTSPSSTSESANGGSGSCAPPPRRSESRSPAWAGTGPAGRRTMGDRPVPPAATRTGVRPGGRHRRREPDLGRPRRGRRAPGRRPARRRPTAGAGTGRRDDRRAYAGGEAAIGWPEVGQPGAAPGRP